MTSAAGYEVFRGSDPEGSPPFQQKHTTLQEVLQERQGVPSLAVSCLDQAFEEATANLVAQELVEASNGGAVACVCSPAILLALQSAYPMLESILLDFNPCHQGMDAESFVIYDYQKPEIIPQHLRHHFAAVLAETPYPTEECALGILRTMQLLTRSLTDPKYYVLTGAALHSEIWDDVGLRPVRFKPRRKAVPHTGIILYTNCKPSQRLIGWE